MNRGLYNATSAMLTIQKHMQSTANNISNVNTTAFKREQSIEGTFDKMMVYYNNQKVGSVNSKVGQRDNVTIHTQGSFKNTERNLDFAIGGEGFFKVQDANGNIRYTRNGIFYKDELGQIVDGNGLYLMGKNGRIVISNSNNSISIDKYGNISIGENKIDTIDVVDLQKAEKTGLGYYKAQSEEPSQSEVFQGFLEMSNVDMSKEMSDLIILQRSYQFNQKMVMSQDELNKKVISDLLK